MIICHDPKLIYIAVPKTGSTATWMMLQTIGAKRIEHNGRGHHDPFITPEIKKDYFLFATVRCPFRRAVSRYLYVRRHPWHPVYPIASVNTFTDSIQKARDIGLWESQAAFLAHCTAEIDYLIKHEEGLVEGLRQVPGMQNVEVRVENTSEYTKPWTDFYDDQSEQLVRAYYADTFELLGYPNTIQETLLKYPNS